MAYLVYGRSPRFGQLIPLDNLLLLGSHKCESISGGGKVTVMVAVTKKMNLGSMSVDEMWGLYEEICRVLSVRMTSEKRQLEKRLGQLRRDKLISLPSKSLTGIKESASGPRRKYPRVYPKYRNPQVPSETWSGRGKTPRWLVAALKTGHQLEEFAINSPGGTERKQKNNAPNAR